VRLGAIGQDGMIDEGGVLVSPNLTFPDYPDMSTFNPAVLGSPPAEEGITTLEFPEEWYSQEGTVPKFVVDVYGKPVDAIPCLKGQGPLRPGQQFCAAAAKTNWLMWALIAAGVIMMSRRQR